MALRQRKVHLVLHEVIMWVGTSTALASFYFIFSAKPSEAPSGLFDTFCVSVCPRLTPDPTAVRAGTSISDVCKITSAYAVEMPPQEPPTQLQ